MMHSHREGGTIEDSPQTAAERRGSKPARLSDAAGAVRIRLLGTFEVSTGSRVIREGEWRLRKAASLVKLLALAPDHRLHREQIMDLLWPDLAPKAAANNLHQALHIARRTLEPNAATHQYLSTEGQSLALYPNGGLWVDTEASEEAAQETSRRTGRRWTSTPGTYCRAIATRIGRRASGKNSGGRTLPCSSSWPPFMKDAGITASPSRRS
jgi:hypothetical protein